MFTGIIEEVGKIEKFEKTEGGATATISCDAILKDKAIGQSIAINGACLTITKLHDKSFECDIINETLDKTNLGALKEGHRVNMEGALKANQALDGHLVQGHIDTLGTAKNITKSEKETRIEIEFPEGISHLLAFKGSITVNGISLTIAKLNEKTFEVAIIPHTIEQTNLGDLQVGEKINLEIDVIARYIERMLEARNGQAKFEFLKERGFI